MFKKVDKKSQITFHLMDLIHKTGKHDWMPYYNFMAILVPWHILDQDPLFVALAKKRKFQAGILRMDPNTCYNWHVDTDRNVSLNMLILDDGNSKCIFSPKYELVTPISELKYKESTYYILNTQVPHIVFNFSEPRYLFSLEFLEEDKGLTYDELCADIQGLNYGN